MARLQMLGLHREKKYKKRFLKKNFFVKCNILSNTYPISVFENFLRSSLKEYLSTVAPMCHNRHVMSCHPSSFTNVCFSAKIKFSNVAKCRWGS